MERATEEPRGTAQRVLVVDDDPSVRRLFAMALGLAGFDVLTAADGREALETARRSRVDAVLLDNGMPGLDGPTTLAGLRERAETRFIPVIMVTGFGDVADRVAGLEAGATDYLVKPVDTDELVARVRAHLRDRTALRSSLERRLRSRSRVAELLASAESAHDPEGIASSVCRHVMELDEVRAAAVAVFPPSGPGRVLGTAGDLAPTGAPVPVALAGELQRRERGEGWIAYRTDLPPGLSQIPLVPEDARDAAFAPLQAGGLVGVLALAPADHAVGGERAVARCLATAVDLAPIVSALLAPALARRGETQAARAHLRRIIDREQFRPVFQPIIDLASDEVCGYEALTRFADGSPPARQFMGAHQLGLGTELEAVTAASAVRAARALPGNAWLSINVSPAFLAAERDLAAVLDDADRPVVLELTEHDPIEDYASVLRALLPLRPGTHLSVDDAGAGYACLTHVLALRPEYVKLDRSWISSIEQDPARQALVAGLGSVARETGSVLIAEGVERDAERAMLAHLEVPLGQGFLLGEPSRA